MRDETTAGWLASGSETYTVDVVNPETGDKAVVTLKRLNAGEYAEVQDAMFDSERGEGTTRQVLVRHAIVDWTLPIGAYSPDKVAALDPAIFMQIYAGMRKEDLNPFGQAVRLAAELKVAAEAMTPTDESALAPSADVAVE